jgi:hypothetical protein
VPTLAAKDKVAVEAAANANASRLFAISAARATACLSSPKPAGPFYAVSAFRLAAHNAAHKTEKTKPLRQKDTKKTSNGFMCFVNW